MEPEILRRGKNFHQRVQTDWEKTAEGQIRREHGVVFGFGIKSVVHTRRGRMDLFVNELGDFVVIVEIKSTDWEKVKSKNRRRLLGSHRRQVWAYVQKYLDVDGVSVCPGIIYPRAPRHADIRREIEAYFSEHLLQLVWYDDS